MSWFTYYWPVALGFICLFALVVLYLWMFTGLPTKEQLEKVREWLLFAVIQVEKDLGSGTGKLKLRTAYDMFIQRFPDLAMFIPFNRFSALVDDALEEMRAMLEVNQAVKSFVAEGGKWHG